MAIDELVGDAIEAGEELLNGLEAEGFPIVAAFWLKKSEDETWYFYIATSKVEQDGPAAAYQELYRIMPPSLGWVLKTDVKLIGAETPLAKAVLDLYQTYRPGQHPIRFPGPQLGPVFIQEAYLYPPV